MTCYQAFSQLGTLHYYISLDQFYLSGSIVPPFEYGMRKEKSILEDASQEEAPSKEIEYQHLALGGKRCVELNVWVTTSYFM